MFEKIKDIINDRKANFYFEVLLDNFYNDYNNKIKKGENTLNCYGNITLNAKELNPSIIEKLFLKASEIGAVITEESYHDIVSLTIKEKGNGYGHTLANKK